MKHSKPLWALVGITLATLFCAARGSIASEPSGSPSATPAQQRPAGEVHTLTVDKPYNYYGTFNYAAPTTPPSSEGRWKIVGEIATVCSAIFFAIFTGLLWYLGRKQKKTAEAVETIARQSVELPTLATGLLEDFGRKQQKLAEAVDTIARQSIELTTLTAGLLQNFGRRGNDMVETAETIARQSVELTALVADLLGDFRRRQLEVAEASETAARRNEELAALAAGWLGDLGRHQQETAAAAQVTARQSVELTALVADLLGDFSRHQQEMAAAAQATARQSVELTTLALNAERPYLFVEEQEIGMSLPMPTTLAARSMAENIAIEPLRYAVAGSSNIANVTLRFMLRNRGKGISVVRRIRVRMLLGRGALKNTDLKLAAIGTTDGNVRANVIGGGEKAEGFCLGLRLPLQTLDEVRQFNLSLRFVIVVSHADVFGRPFVTTRAFEYRPPIRSTVFAGSPDYPSMLLPVLRDGRMRGR